LFWVWNFRRKNRKSIIEKLEQVKSEKEVMIVNKPREVDDILKHLEKEIPW